MIRAIRNSRAYAFALGFFEHLKFDEDGRTSDDMAWNEAYDSGWNLADRITFRNAKDY